MLIHKETFRRLAVLMFALSVLSGPPLALAQQAPQTVDGKASSSKSEISAGYDVVSIKPHKEDDSNRISGWRLTPSGFSGKDVSVRSLIMSAYHLIMPDQISGLPAWADSETFDIEAKLDPDNTAALAKMSAEDQQTRNDLMMRALLTDRFKLKASHSKKDLPVYNLVIAKGGPKLKKASSIENSGYSTNVARICKMTSKSLDVPSLAGGLSNFAGRLVIDKTGLTGRYEVTLSWAFNDSFTDSAPAIFTAVQEQLGLKLEPAKAPVDVVVIDHLERPSEN